MYFKVSDLQLNDKLIARFCHKRKQKQPFYLELFPAVIPIRAKKRGIFPSIWARAFGCTELFRFQIYPYFYTRFLKRDKIFSQLNCL